MMSNGDHPNVVLIWQGDGHAHVSLEEVLDMAMTHAAFGQTVCVWLCADSVQTVITQPQLNDKLTLLSEMGMNVFCDQSQHLPTAAPTVRPVPVTLRQQLISHASHSFTF